MKELTLTQLETELFESSCSDGAEMRASKRQLAQELASTSGHLVEIYACDGYVLDAILPE